MKFNIPFLNRKGEQSTDYDWNKLFQSIFRNIASGSAQGMPDDPDAQVKQGYAGNIDWYSIVGRIMAMSSQAPIKLYDMRGKKPVEVLSHDLLDILHRPNSTQSQKEFENLWTIYYLTIGDAFMYKPIIEFGKDTDKTTEMYMMPSHEVEVVTSNDWMNPIRGYILKRDTQIEFSKESVFHSRFVDPRFGNGDDYYGMSPLVAAAKTVSKNTAIEESELKQGENQSPAYMIQRKTDKNELNAGFSQQQKEAYEKALKDYSKKYKGGTPFVNMMPIEVLRLGLTTTDLNTLASSLDGLRKMCNALHMPPVLFGDPDNGNYNNWETAIKAAWTQGIKPVKTDFVYALNNFLIRPVKEYKGLQYMVDYSGIAELQADLKTKVETLRLARGTANEVREAAGLDPYDSEEMNIPIFSSQDIPLSDFLIDLTDGDKSDYTPDSKD